MFFRGDSKTEFVDIDSKHMPSFKEIEKEKVKGAFIYKKQRQYLLKHRTGNRYSIMLFSVNAGKIIFRDWKNALLLFAVLLKKINIL